MSRKSQRSVKKQLPLWMTILLLIAGAVYYLAIYTTLLDPLLVKVGMLDAPLAEETSVGTPEQTDSQSVSATMPVEGLEIPILLEKRPSQLIEHLAYTVDFNPKWNIPNWVAYSLIREETEGEEERANHFKPDPLVQGDPVVTKDYSNSGYDRGHMAPAADFKWSEQAMRESFYMTNMCPQNHNLNAGDWKELEELVRKLAAQYGCIYVCCGPVVNSRPKTIGTDRKIAVPAAFFKALLRQKDNGEWTSIGFLFSNKAGNRPLTDYALTIDELQTTTGIDFFPLLDDQIEQQVESIYHLEDFNLATIISP